MEESSTDSAGFHYSDSFSLPSEPPDIRNWFSSYKYESFVLDTCDDAFGTKPRGDAIDRDSSEPLKIEEGQTFSEVPDSSYSQSVLNEPHHPDNWLSTCVPETCGLDHDDDDEEFETAPSEGKVDAFSKEGIENLEKSNSKNSDLRTPPERPSSGELFRNECSPSRECFNYDFDKIKPLTKVLDSEYSQSVLHEPHHPDNWISTCLPETCGSDLEEDEFSQTKEGIDKGENFENPNSKSCCDLDALEKPSSDEIVNEEERHSQKENLVPYSQVSILSEPPEIKNWFSSYAYESPVLDGEINNGGVFESESQHVDNSFIDQEPKEDGELNSHSIDKEPNTKLTPDEHSASSFKPAGSTGPSSTSGFVTTRKNKSTKRLNHNENSYPGSTQHAAAKCLKSERLVISSSRNRNVLSERTNVVLQPQPEVTGKWKCPQRNKPAMGPPLKQLRLERWVTKL